MSPCAHRTLHYIQLLIICNNVRKEQTDAFGLELRYTEGES